MRTAIQLYTLRDLDEPLTDTIERVGDTALDAVEFAGLGDEPTDQIAAALDDADLDVMAAHVGLDALDDDLDETVEDYRAVGCDHVVVPWLDPEDFASREAVEETAHRLASVGDRVRDRGLDLSYHNHNQEFQPVDGVAAFEVLAEEAPDLTFELDVGWVLAGGHDPAEMIRDLGDRIPVVHFKDVDVGANVPEGGQAGFSTDDHQPVELGEGDLDLDAVAAAADDVGVGWACYEHDVPDAPVESLRHGSDRLTSLVR
jgi:sugar phosphate isomerase/epimerase